jgi:uncharacterized protein (DUF2126 family)/transglutaminase-like putative cysteine protease
MSTRIRLNHFTQYKYDKPVRLSPHIIRLRPAVHTRVPILSYSLTVCPEDHFINWQQDPFGNYQARFVFPKPTQEFSVKVELVADMKVFNPFDFFVETYAEKYPFDYHPLLKQELAPFLISKDSSPIFESYLNSVSREPRSINDFLVDLNQKISRDISYVIRMEPGVQTCQETLNFKSGSCRDSAYLLVQVLRRLGLAARFVSGYLVQLKPDQVPLDGPKGPTEDFTDLHAWAEVYIPGAGWIGLDATSGLMAGEGHIPLACTPEPESAAAVTGFVDPANSEFQFSMSVTRLEETPRVTKPYTPETWNQILDLGKSIDKLTQKSGLSLTIGGEPTFVSNKNRDAYEWNFGAVGHEKYRLSEDILWNLEKKFGSGSLFQYCQGKWYPGELIPRWSLNCYWRKDGEPVWSDPSLFSRESDKTEISLDQMKSFAISFSETLNVNPDYLIPAYEDQLYILWKDGTIPADSDKKAKDLDKFEKKERERIRNQIQTGVGDPVGFVLPLEYNYIDDYWQTNRWEWPRDHFYLIPGDSPLGFRLPLNSLIGNFSPFPDLDPTRKMGKLPSKKDFSKFRIKKQNKRQSVPNPDFRSKTALCFEIRNGKLRIFLPPIPELATFLDLVDAIESVSQKLNIPVILEGYDPARDTRLERYQITPDPGVIEVNLHPSSNFEEICKKTEILYTSAEETGLIAEKFMLDGRHTGTGGGNHITVGAATPLESPFLKRPDLLRSLIAYWQNHPGLSYLFSGQFIGPTSQSPRIDEARMDSLYELEIAFQQVDSDPKNTPPWLLDRLFRNILVDITGNTHRTEISIDKMYDPNSPTGRLGLVEFRAFEMPPHYQMSVIQQLLIQALILRFWNNPYKGLPVRWDTKLQDEFKLPYFIWKDFLSVLDDLNSHGFKFKSDFFLPFFEFRFPEYGTRELDGIRLELRMALEAWNVLGEETTSFGTSRAVDSAVERVQVKISGFQPERYTLSCNGYEVPLQPTQRVGEYVAGVRFKAWGAIQTLHPNLPVAKELKFTIWDRWNQSALGGCIYHISHPGGRSYDVFPINSFEAESRRISRFWNFGHSSSDKYFELKRTENNYLPFTLDLRFSRG